MIRVVLGHRGALLSGALAAVLSKESDVEVVAVVGQASEVVPAVVRGRPHVLVLDSDLPGEPGLGEVCRESAARGILLLIEREKSAGTGLRLVRDLPTVGLIATDASPNELVTAVRQIADGNPVLDADFALAALRAGRNPLTGRECEVLRLVDTGATAQEIARRLCLSAGTVRNYLSHILAKTGARSRIDAIRKARDAGWI